MADEPKYEIINLSKLKLDSENPRLPKSMHGKSEEDIIEFMLLDASLIELMLAIGANNFFPGEQLLVVPDNGHYKVIEGNRRLSALKLLSNPELGKVQKIKIAQVLEEAKHKPQEIPCLIFKEEQEIHNYLGYRHITGIKEWKLLEKARYLDGLKGQNYRSIPLNQAAREIAKIIGSRADYVKRILVGYEIYKKIEDNAFYRLRDLDDTTFHFNYIADSLNKANIYQFLGVNWEADDPAQNINSSNLEKWTKWLFEKNDQNRPRLMGTSGELTMLNQVLGNENAREAFDAKGMALEDAHELTDDIDLRFESSIKKSLNALEQADSIAHRVNEFYTDMQDDLQSIRRLANKIKIAKETADEEDFG